ncbi:MAG: protein kinase [Planctomycetes bacterium]|nr:protein kinase [Planctomycetota bacterium]
MDTTSGQQVPPLPQRVVGQYHLLAQLGHTPTGPIYLARLPHKETLLALKALPPLGPEEMARLRQDTSLLGRVEHPGVIRPLEVGVERGRAFVVTEHVPGSTLREQLDRRGPLPARQAARLVADAADALQALHDAGVVHRHLDPSVIVVDGRDGRPKLAELGLARDPRRPPAPGQPPFLPFCLAPEQLRGEPAQPRSDVYALGAVLYELLCGSPPFEGQSWSELSQAVQAGDPEPPGELVAGVPRAIERACLKALALEPDDRPTAGELALLLRRAAGGEDARGGSPLLVAALVVAVLGVVGAAGWGAWERRGRGEAESALAVAQADLERLRRELAAAHETGAAREAELRQAREQAARKQQEVEQAQNLARADAARAKTATDQLRRELSQRVEQIAGIQGLGAGQIGPIVDALAAALEPAPELTRLRARLLYNRRRMDDLRALVRAARARGGELPPELVYLELRVEPDPARAQELVAQLAALPEDTAYGALGRLFALQAAAQQGVPTDQALGLLQRARARDPKDPHLLAVFSEVAANLAFQGNNPQHVQQALALAVEWVDADPTSSDAYLQRARLTLHLFQLTQGQRRELPARALTDLRVARGLSDAPAVWMESAKAHLSLGYAEVAQAEVLEGRRRAEAMGDQGELARSLALLGACRALMGDENGAVQQWTEALRAFPNMAGTYDLVTFLPRLGREGQQRVLQAAPPQVRQQLEAVLRQVGGGR